MFAHAEGIIQGKVLERVDNNVRISAVEDSIEPRAFVFYIRFFQMEKLVFQGCGLFLLRFEL